MPPLYEVTITTTHLIPAADAFQAKSLVSNHVKEVTSPHRIVDIKAEIVIEHD